MNINELEKTIPTLENQTNKSFPFLIREIKLRKLLCLR